MKSYYSIKQSAAAVALCLMTEISFAQVNCSNGVDYKNSCNPYSTQFLEVDTKKITSKRDKSPKANDNNTIVKSYFNRLLDRYSSTYSGRAGLQSLIDRRSYKDLNNSKSSDDTKIKSTDSSSKIKNSKDKISSSNKTVNVKHVEILDKKQSITTKKETHKSIALESKKPIKVVKNKLANKESKKIVKVINSKSTLYKVKKGDTLSSLAKKFSTTVAKITTLNRTNKKFILKFDTTIKVPLNSVANSSKKDKLNNKVALKKSKLVKKDIHKIKRGDTLLSIAKKYNLSITKLREINRLGRSSKIKIGEKIYLKPRRVARKLKKSFSYQKSIKFKKVSSLRYKKRIRVVATAYTSHRNQTDSTPFLAAWNNRIRPGMKIIAVSPDLIRKYGLTNGVKVKIMGLKGYYIVRDKMNKRLRNHIDIYMGVNKRRALRWGRRRITLYW